MTLPAQLGTDIPRITLGGQAWPVPKLALGQNRKLQPIFSRVVDRIFGDNQVHLTALTEQDIDDLAEIAFVALTRAHPQITREEFADMPIGALDLCGAVLIIMEQSGLFRAPQSTSAGEA